MRPQPAMGLVATVSLIVGYVVGATIFILPGALLRDTGSGVFVAYLLAAVPAVIAALVMAQIGSAYQRGGALFDFLRDHIGDWASFTYAWLFVSLAAIVIPAIAAGLADYVSEYVPGLPPGLAALLAIALFALLNTLGVQTASRAQTGMVVLFIVVLLGFALAGMASGDTGRLLPVAPAGWRPLLSAAATAYFSYVGVFVVAEVAGEIRDPQRTIPRAVLLSLAVVVLVYTVVPLALAMLTADPEQAHETLAMRQAAQRIFPPALLHVLSIAAICAAATSINAILMGLSRDLQEAARSRQAPPFLGRSNRAGVPAAAIFVIAALAGAGVLAGGTVLQYARLAIIGLMVVQVLTAIALWRFAGTRPAAGRTGFELPPLTLRGLALLYGSSSLAFFLLLVTEQPRALAWLGAYLLVGYAFFFLLQRLTADDNGGYQRSPTDLSLQEHCFDERVDGAKE